MESPSQKEPRSRRRILLVDDEAAVLDGLRRIMRPHRKSWAIETAGDGLAALDRLRARAFDAIVSDMRMPKLDGVELLKQAGELQPGIIRITLTGDPTETAMLRSAGVTHQMLSKPCDSRILIEALERSFRLRETLGSSELITLAGRLKQLPSLPDLYTRLMEELQSPEVSVSSVGRLVAQDMAMSAKLLQLVNSAFFGLSREVTNPERAVVVLGVETVRALVLMFHVFDQLDQARGSGVPLDRLFQYGILTGKTARLIAKDAGLGKAELDDAYMGGLLHDVGLLVLGAAFRDEMREVVDEAHVSGDPLARIEKNRLGATHADVGAYLLGLWGLPNQIVEAVAFHHRPDFIASSTIDSTWATRWGVLAAVRVFSDRFPPFEHDASTLTDADRAVVTEDRFEAWVRDAAELRVGRDDGS